jgi:uncharacterized damage-inducible protein DinB
MDKAGLLLLLDHGYWATQRVLAAAAKLTDEQFTAPSNVTTRSLRATLVHTLDVEWSWRLRLQGQPVEMWGPDQEMREEDIPTTTILAGRWQDDEREMRAWLERLSEDELAAAPSAADLGNPLWQYVLHIIIHGFQQRADAATLLSLYGRSPGELEFVDYVDSLQASR